MKSFHSCCSLFYFAFPQKYQSFTYIYKTLSPSSYDFFLASLSDDFDARCWQVLDRISFLALKEMTLKYCSLDTGFGSFTAGFFKCVEEKCFQQECSSCYVNILI